jgi:ABC-type lipoprotein export system ATPase subunit
MVRLEHVVKRYRQGRDDVEILRGVSLNVAAGELLSVIGPSGSGKSTLLHLMAGLDTPTSGEIYVAEKPLSTMSDDELTLFRRRRIGIVFQFFHLLPTLTVEENVALPLLLDGCGLADAGPRVEALLRQVNLAHRRGARVGELSGGEQQRIALCRALVSEPDLLLADEPTGNLDSRAGEEVLEILVQLAATRACTTVLVTHDAKAAGYCERVVEMRDGQLVPQAREREVLVK